MPDLQTRDDLRLRDKRLSSRRMLTLALKAYSVAGIAIALIAIGYFAITLIPVELSTGQRTALVFGGVGVVLAGLSRVMISLLKAREASQVARLRDYEAAALFLSAWNEFEVAARKAIRVDFSESKHTTTRGLLKSLVEKQLIKGDELKIIDFALKVRNYVVHGSAPVPVEVMRDLTDRIREISLRLPRQVEAQSA